MLEFEDVLLAGLARDGGLYVPETWPAIGHDEIARFAGRSFHEVAAEIIAPFVGDAIDHNLLVSMARDAYSSFDHPAVTPIVQLDENRFVLELFHGPTLAFKDVAMQLLARLMDHVLSKRGERATIVGATSGDTGGAAIEAFRGAENVDVVILFPHERVSDVQRRMMTTPDDDNVHAIAVRGTFDDCQALVKGMFNDHGFRDRVKLSGVNSINWARIVAQITYYFVAAVALGAPHRKVSFSVPTGNFGDIFAGYAAKKMGLPVADLIIASNANDILVRALETGAYEMRDVIATTSPSMDIQISSNFERYLFEASGRNSDVVRTQMETLAQARRFELTAQSEAMRSEFRAYSADEADVAQVISKAKSECGYVLDPHSACGVFAAERAAEAVGADNELIPQVVLATAHPAKFPDAIGRITGNVPQLPERLSNLMKMREDFQVVENDLQVVEAEVEARSRVSKKSCAPGVKGTV